MDHHCPNDNGCGVDDGIFLCSLDQSNFGIQIEESWDPVNGFGFYDGISFRTLEQPLDPSSFAPFYNVSSEVDFPDAHECYPVLKYIGQMLMEENSPSPSTPPFLLPVPLPKKKKKKKKMSHDPLALQVAEKSFYEIIGKDYPPPSETLITALERNEQNPDGFSESKDVTNSSDRSSTAAGPRTILDPNELSGKQHHPLYNCFGPSFHTNAIQYLPQLKNSTIWEVGQAGPLTGKNLISSFYSDRETLLQFKKRLEEGNKFLPTAGQLVINLDRYKFPSKLENVELVFKGKKDKNEKLANSLRGRKHHYRDHDSDSYMGRSSKQSAHNEEEVELSEILDRVLLDADSKGLEACCDADVEQPNNELLQGSDFGRNQEKWQDTDSEALDLFAMLISSAQLVVTDDRRTANERLKVIRQHASCTGDPHQRLAFILVYTLEARLAGTGRDLHAALTSKRISAVEELKAFRVYLCAPLRQMFSFFANKMILEAASKATVLHIVDFGITFGFQWPSLIQQLSNRDGGPPKLRITGIEFPQPGFRPAERVEQTGRRLAKYCERFNVPFEYQAIATMNWEKIRIEELKLEKNEVIAVACHFGLKRILDEIVEDDCPRDAVLSLIRKMNPDILVNDVLSAQLSGPFFLTRFREALFFFSTIFDALDNILPRKDMQRNKFEQEFLGPELLNIVACEGLARVERCETYKKWQARYKRAGFKQLPLNQDLMKELRRKVKEGYHKDFMLDEDGCWMLQGWKGKTISAGSCWIPA